MKKKKERRKTEIVCLHCGKDATRTYSLAKYCTDACKQAALRKRDKAKEKSILQKTSPSVLLKEFTIYNNLNALANEAIQGDKKSEALASLRRVETKLDNVAESVKRKKTIRKQHIVLREGEITEVDSVEWHKQNLAAAKRAKEYLKQKNIKQNGDIEE